MKITRFDVVDYLKTAEDIAGYLDAVLDDGDPELLEAALDDIARASRRLLQERGRGAPVVQSAR